MIIIGAKGHAKEVYDICLEKKLPIHYFFDNVSLDNPNVLYEKEIIKSLDEVKKIFNTTPEYIIAIGIPKNRKKVYDLFENINGKIQTIISKTSIISNTSILKSGLNIMHFVFIGSEVQIGKGSLINTRSSIHHNSIIGEFVEIAPGAEILGNCNIGNFTFIGANSTILPNITIGKNVIIAAGSVVTNSIPDNCMAAGNPAKIKKTILPLEY